MLRCVGGGTMMEVTMSCPTEVMSLLTLISRVPLVPTNSYQGDKGRAREWGKLAEGHFGLTGAPSGKWPEGPYSGSG